MPGTELSDLPSDTSSQDRITVDHIHAARWRDLAGVDPRGFTHGPPGDFVFAVDSAGRQLAEVKVNYMIDRHGCDRKEDLIYQIEKALSAFFAYDDSAR